MATLSPLINLPEELCCRIAHHLGAKDAASLRLSCKRLHAAATESLFSFVRLYPNDRSVNRYNSILSAPHLNRLVKRVELNTVDPDAEWEVEGFGAEFEDDALDAFKKFPDFAGLTGVTLRFSPNVSSDQDITEWPEDIAFRRSILQGFFNTLAQPSASRITDVCFNNLQNINDTQFMQSEVAVGLLSRLKALRLYISTELGTEDGIPSLDIVLPELHSFMHQLPSTWLQPTVKNLTTLVLYQDVYFGFFPKLDLRGLHFPNLKTLSLGNYVFSHRWQLDWISSHLDTLENLYLQECPVLYFVKAPSTNSPLDPEGYPIRSAIDSLPATENEQHSNVHRMNDLTWSQILDHFKDNLKCLRKFHLGNSARWMPLFKFGRRVDPLESHMNGMETSFQRGSFQYQGFDSSCTPPSFQDSPRTPKGGDQTIAADDDYWKVRDFDMFAQRKRDRKAWLALLSKIGQPWPWDLVALAERQGLKLG